MDGSNTKRIVILGKSGAGKSSLANTIIGEELFKTDDSPNSKTEECQSETRSVNGRLITLIDTPGFFEKGRSEVELRREIVKCIIKCAPGPHAFLIVLKKENFTEQEQAVVDTIQGDFSEEAFKYAAVVFTHGNELAVGQSIQGFVKQSQDVSDLVRRCGGRCHVVDNKYWDKNQQDNDRRSQAQVKELLKIIDKMAMENKGSWSHEMLQVEEMRKQQEQQDDYRSNQIQVEELLQTIDKMVLDNNGSCYSNEMLQTVKDMRKQEEENIRKSPGNMTEREIREKAEANVLEKILIRLAGVGTGALLGALLGVSVMVGLVTTALKGIKPLIPLGKKVYKDLTGSKNTGKKAGGAAVVTVETAAVARAAKVRAARETVVVAGGAAGETVTVARAAAAGGTAAVAEGGAAAGGKAAGATAAAGIITAVKTSIVAGAVTGGVTGYFAAEGAETPQEAAQRAAVAVKDGAAFVLDAANDVMEKILTSK